jgi:extracellular factor (EF) 3-hydroxypalmitic acid methyl ester biosynthesis protein
MPEETDAKPRFREFARRVRLYRHMDVALQQIRDGQVMAGMCRMQLMLKERRRELPADAWRQFVKQLQEHPLLDVLRTDPFTERARTKPRGYAGDAVMMDYIYGYGVRQFDSLPDVGRKIFEYATGTAAPQAVRFRRQLLAEFIDATARHLDRPADVLALAAGHLREVDLSCAARHGRANILALDQDEESLAVIREAYGHYGVRVAHASVRRIIAGRVQLEPCDLAYSAGLYDYLPAAAATRLTAILFEAVRPGGRLLVANFLPNIFDLGYMEGVMDWELIYRDDAEMRTLVGEIDTREIGALDQFHDPMDNITFLTVTKAG